MRLRVIRRSRGLRGACALGLLVLGVGGAVGRRLRLRLLGGVGTTLSHAKVPLLRGSLARRERGLDSRPVPREPAPDEDGLALARAREPHPAELVPAAGEVEQALPVAPGEAHHALGPQHVARQAREHALERGLVQQPRRAPDEAGDVVHVEVPGGGASARARSRQLATPVANRRSLSRAPRTERKRSARGFSRRTRFSIRSRAARRPGRSCSPRRSRPRRSGAR